MNIAAENVAKILEERDGISFQDAMEQVQEWVDGELEELMAIGADYGSVCEAFLDEFGLEPDYLFELIM